MRVKLREQSGEGDGDFSLQYILEGMGWEVGTSAFSSRRPGGRGSALRLLRFSPGLREWRPLKQTHTLCLCRRDANGDGLPLGPSCPQNPGNHCSSNDRI